MTELDRLRAENLALREEIAEWERQAAEAAGAAADDQRIERLRQCFGVSVAPARLLAKLLDRSPNVVDREAALAVRGRLARTDDPDSRVCDAMIWGLRRALGRGVGDVVRSRYGRGWWISRDDAARVLAAAGLDA